MDFKEFPKISRLDNARMLVTQKIHGSNAAVAIYNVGTEEEPSSLPVLAKEYMKDTQEEKQLDSVLEDELRCLKKNLFAWLKLMVEEKKRA